jgi:hypothetical protein
VLRDWSEWLDVGAYPFLVDDRLERAIDKVQNLEPPSVDIGNIDIADVVNRMLYRLIRTAQLHVEEGPRRDALVKLQGRSPIQVLGILDELVSIPVGELLKTFGEFHIEEWFAKWSTVGATPEEHMKIPSKSPYWPR